MTTLEHGWYRCPSCGNRTEAIDDSGDHPDCPNCQSAAAPEPLSYGDESGDPALPEGNDPSNQGGDSEY